MPPEPGIKAAAIALSHAGRDRPYWLIPPAAESVRGVPLVLQLHGRGIDPVMFDRWTGFSAAHGLGALMMVRRRAGPCVGVDDWARLWVRVGGARENPLITTLPPDTTVRRWTGAASRSDVIFYPVEGGGHTWPGMRTWVPPIFGRASNAFDATRVIWEFLAAHAREP